MSDMKTPGVYIVEKNAFPNSVVEVATAIPAFVGFTEKAEKGSQSLRNVPLRISSMVEYEKYFGGAPSMKYDLIDGASLEKFIKELIPDKSPATSGASDIDSDKIPEKYEKEGFPKGSYDELLAYRSSYLQAYQNLQKNIVLDGREYSLRSSKSLFTMYQHVKLFFANGGGCCYVVSVGGYGSEIDHKTLIAGIEILKKEQEPTLLIIPEAVNLQMEDCYTVNKKMLSHCGEMKNRFAILDIHDGYGSDVASIAKKFREKIGDTFLNYGSAYYPWLDTSVVDVQRVSEWISKDSILYLGLLNCKAATKDNKHKYCCFLLHHFYGLIAPNKVDLKNMICYMVCRQDELLMENVKKTPENEIYGNILKAAKDRMPELTDAEKNEVVSEWWKKRTDEETIRKVLSRIVNRLPPSAAMAGIYTMVDSTRGVWKAPANVSLNMVISPTVDITDDEQKDLNAPVDSDSKPINAIRHFVGFGIQVWGARTLDNKNLDWRYINVRRTMLFLEESIKNATRFYVFEPNDAHTWLNVKCMIENFLRDVWKRGGLAGASTEDAFSVHVGLGDTMTPKNILDGVMRIVVLVAISHPAEFIEITFQQQIQKS